MEMSCKVHRTHSSVVTNRCKNISPFSLYIFCQNYKQQNHIQSTLYRNPYFSVIPVFHFLKQLVLLSVSIAPYCTSKFSNFKHL